MKAVQRSVLIGLAIGLCGLSQVGALAQTAPISAESPGDAAVQNPRQAARAEKLKAGVAKRLARGTKLDRTRQMAEWKAARSKGGDLQRFDQPQEAQTHFLSKRLAEGQSAIGPGDYLGALDQSNQMPVYSTPKRQFVSGPGVTSTGNGVVGGTISQPSSSGALATGWEPLGPGNVGGRTRAILIHPTTPNTMWAAGVAGGIWKSLDGGASWTPKADLVINMAVNSMVLDPRNPDVIYAGTGEGFFNADAVRGAGILKSTDGGETWTQLASTANSDFFYVQKLVLSKGSSQRLYAATRTGIWRSNDAGASWSKVLNGGLDGCMDLAIQTDRPLANVFASCGSFDNDAATGIYRALDTANSQTWTKVHSPTNMGRTSLAIAPSNQSVIYAMSANNVSSGLLAVYRSATSGSAGSWTTQVDSSSATKLNTVLLSNPVYAFLADCGYGSANNTTLTQGWYDNMLAVDPADPNIVWAGGIDLFRSDDGGKNWGQASHWWFTEGVDPEYNHADQHTVAFHPQYDGVTNKIMFTGNDGGIHVTMNARAPVSYSPSPVNPSSPVCGNTAPGVLSWQTRNNGYQVTQFYHGAVSGDGNKFLAGAQDNGTRSGSVGNLNWGTVSGGDGGYVAIHPTNSNMMWGEFTGKSMYRTENSGATTSDFTSGNNESSGNFLFITPFAQDPNNPNIMWTGGALPWRTTVAAVVPLPSTVWVRAGGRNTAGNNFQARVSAVAVSPLNSDRVYMGTQAISGTPAVSGVVWTTGIGTTAVATTAWTGSKPRPGINYVSWITPDPVTVGTVYATISTFNDATGQGHVFKSTDFGATWVNIDGSGATGIPDVPVHCVAIDPANPLRLYAGTDIGVFVSIDGGANWARENTGFANVIVESLSIKGRYIYAFTHGRSTFRAALPPL